jgi:hypothetical protein
VPVTILTRRRIGLQVSVAKEIVAAGTTEAPNQRSRTLADQLNEAAGWAETHGYRRGGSGDNSEIGP